MTGENFSVQKLAGLKKYLLLIAILLFAGLFWQCEKNSLNITADTGNFGFFSDLNELPANNDALKINSAAVHGELLKTVLNYSGGCKTHQIHFYIRNGFLLSSPPQAEIFIFHNANSDSCEAYISRAYYLNLSELSERYRSQFQKEGKLILKIYPPGSSKAFSPAPVMQIH